jgi:hypothetical protein
LRETIEDYISKNITAEGAWIGSVDGIMRLITPPALASDARELAESIYEITTDCLAQCVSRVAVLLASRQGEAPMISDYTQGYEDCFAGSPNREVTGSRHPSETTPEGGEG